MVLWTMIGAVLLVALVYCISLYNGLIALRENVKKAWSNIDVLLAQRHDELPKLVEACKAYMKHERETLERVMLARAGVEQAREHSDVEAVGQAETRLRDGLGRLFALAESYPALRADQTFRHLQTRISQLEESIADRRELYNDSVNINNVRIEQVPDVLVARGFGFQRWDLLEFSESQVADVDLKRLLP